MSWAEVDWAVVLATFVGPIAAVGVTLWHQGRSGEKDAQRSAYSTMMRNRRHFMSADFVGAFNLIPVYFNKKKEVIDRYRKVLEVVNDPTWHQEGAVPQMSQRLTNEVALLLSAMSVAVGQPVQQLDILNGAYAPQGWADEEQSQRAVRSAVMQVLEGSRSIAINVRDEAVPLPEKPFQSVADMFVPQTKAD